MPSFLLYCSTVDRNAGKCLSMKLDVLQLLILHTSAVLCGFPWVHLNRYCCVACSQGPDPR